MLTANWSYTFSFTNSSFCVCVCLWFQVYDGSDRLRRRRDKWSRTEGWRTACRLSIHPPWKDRPFASGHWKWQKGKSQHPIRAERGGVSNWLLTLNTFTLFFNVYVSITKYTIHCLNTGLHLSVVWTELNIPLAANPSLLWCSWRQLHSGGEEDLCRNWYASFTKSVRCYNLITTTGKPRCKQFCIPARTSVDHDDMFD